MPQTIQIIYSPIAASNSDQQHIHLTSKKLASSGIMSFRRFLGPKTLRHSCIVLILPVNAAPNAWCGLELDPTLFNQRCFEQNFPQILALVQQSLNIFLNHYKLSWQNNLVLFFSALEIYRLNEARNLSWNWSLLVSQSTPFLETLWIGSAADHVSTALWQKNATAIWKTFLSRENVLLKRQSTISVGGWWMLTLLFGTLFV